MEIFKQFPFGYKDKIFKSSDINILYNDIFQKEISRGIKKNIYEIIPESFTTQQYGFTSVEIHHQSSYIMHTKKPSIFFGNIDLKEGGKSESIKAVEERINEPIPSEIIKLSRLFIFERIALETFLFLEENGPSNIELLISELIPKVKIFKIISDLSRFDLIEVNEDIISLTIKGKKIIKKLLTDCQGIDYK